MSHPTPEFLYRLQPTRPAMLTEGPTPEERTAVAARVPHAPRRRRRGPALRAHADDRLLDVRDRDLPCRLPAEAERLVAEDPAVRARVMRAELFPFRIAGVSPRLA